MAAAADILSLENAVFASFALYGTLSLCKMLDMALWTAIKRIQTNTFINKEDLAIGKSFLSDAEKEKMKTKTDDRVERIRRNHLNDLENIPAFLLVGLFYVMTNPNPWMATWHFRLFLISRVVHTFAYQFAAPPPTRALAFGAGYAVIVSMAIRVIINTWRFY